MLISGEQTTWVEAAVVMAGLLSAGFLVSWLGTDVFRCPRWLYVAVLAVTTLGAAGIVAEVAGSSLTEMVGHRWRLGLLGAVITGLFGGVGIRKKEPVTQHLAGRQLRAAAMWEGLVYGTAEGVLLSGLPVFITWQAAADASWSDAAAFLVGMLASVVMITVHHLGYWDFRSRKLGLAIVGCGLLTLGYLATGSLVAPALGHVLLHILGITGGIQLPPHVRANVVGDSTVHA